MYSHYQCIVQNAYLLKEEGNLFFKAKDYKRALAKYTRVQCYTNSVLPAKDEQVKMYQNMTKESKVSNK